MLRISSNSKRIRDAINLDLPVKKPYIQLGSNDRVTNGQETKKETTKEKEQKIKKDMTDAVGELETLLKHMIIEDVQKRICDDKVQDAKKSIAAIVETLPGTAVIKQIIKLNDSYQVPDGKNAPMIRTGYQVEAHRSMIKTIIPMVYGDDIDRYREAIIKYWGFENIRTRIAIMWPRRHGKTWTVASMGASMAYTVRGKRMVILSTGERASNMMSEHLMKFFLQLPGASDMIAKRTNEHIIISANRDPDDPEAFHIYSLPSSPTKTRGISADLLIFEEASFISEKMFTDIALPLDSMIRTAIMAISSPPTDLYNYFYKFFDMKTDEGNTLYDTFRIVSMCDSCIEQKKAECPHVVDFERPHWKSLEKEKAVKKQYRDAASLRREIYGVMESNEMSVFRKPDIEAWEKGPTYTFERSPDYLFIAIDPSGGGSGSDTAWMAGAPNEHDAFVVSFSFLTNSPQSPYGSQRESQRVIASTKICIYVGYSKSSRSTQRPGFVFPTPNRYLCTASRIKRRRPPRAGRQFCVQYS
jgi:hypothetical protein